jgi:hypothetical protein
MVRTWFNFVGFEVLLSVVLKSSVFWDITPSSSLKVSWHFRASNKHGLVPASRSFLASLALQPWRWRWHVSPKCWLTFNRLHGITSQNLIVAFQFLERLYFRILFLFGGIVPSTVDMYFSVICRVFNDRFQLCRLYNIATC